MTIFLVVPLILHSLLLLAQVWRSVPSGTAPFDRIKPTLLRRLSQYLLNFIKWRLLLLALLATATFNFLATRVIGLRADPPSIHDLPIPIVYFLLLPLDEG